jgi:hypothetical protein
MHAFFPEQAEACPQFLGIPSAYVTRGAHSAMCSISFLLAMPGMSIDFLLGCFRLLASSHREAEMIYSDADLSFAVC